MKKLKLKDLELSEQEILSRSQLKNVLGGSGGSAGCVCNTGKTCPPETSSCAVGVIDGVETISCDGVRSPC